MKYTFTVSHFKAEHKSNIKTLYKNQGPNYFFMYFLKKKFDQSFPEKKSLYVHNWIYVSYHCVYRQSVLYETIVIVT